MSANLQTVEGYNVIVAFAPGTPSSADPPYVSFRDYHRISVVILGDNATTVTGSAVALVQATDTSGTGEKALAFTSVHRNIDVAAGSSLTEATVSSNTFTTVATDNKNSLYVIDITPDMLDIANGFDCVAVTLGNTTAQAVAALYLCGPKKGGGLN
jgi:hypothetical protein